MGKVLFVEDEPWMAEPYGCFLEDNGHTYDIAQDGEEALSSIREEPPDLLVLDIMFPPESLESALAKGRDAIKKLVEGGIFAGVDLYQQVRREFPEMRVLVFSVLAEESIRDRAADLDQDVEFDCEFMQKGENPRTVYERILRLLEQPALRNR